MNHAFLPRVATARLPDNYQRAKAAMMACLKAAPAEFYAKYEAAKAALQECAAVDECANWPTMAALGSYARQSQDKSLERLARRVQARLRDVTYTTPPSDTASRGGGIA